MTDSPYLSMRDLADRWRLSVQTIYNRRNQNRLDLAAVRDGKRVLFRLADVEEYERTWRPA